MLHSDTQAREKRSRESETRVDIKTLLAPLLQCGKKYSDCESRDSNTTRGCDDEGAPEDQAPFLYENLAK